MDSISANRRSLASFAEEIHSRKVNFFLTAEGNQFEVTLVKCPHKSKVRNAVLSSKVTITVRDGAAGSDGQMKEIKTSMRKLGKELAKLEKQLQQQCAGSELSWRVKQAGYGELPPANSELSSLETEMTALKAGREENNVQEKCREAILSVNSTIGKLQGKVREGLAKYQDPSTEKLVDPKTSESAKDQKDLTNLSRIIQNLSDVQADLAELYSANDQSLSERISKDPHKVIDDVARFKWDVCQAIRAFEHADMKASEYAQLKKEFVDISNTLKSQIDDCIGENAQSSLPEDVKNELSMHGEELANMGNLFEGWLYARGGVKDTDVTPPTDMPNVKDDVMELDAEAGAELDAEAGAELDAEAGAELDAEAGAELDAEAGAELDAEVDVKVEGKWRSQLIGKWTKADKKVES